MLKRYVTIMTQVASPLLWGNGDMQTDLRSDAVRNNRDEEKSHRNRKCPGAEDRTPSAYVFAAICSRMSEMKETYPYHHPNQG